MDEVYTFRTQEESELNSLLSLLISSGGAGATESEIITAIDELPGAIEASGTAVLDVERESGLLDLLEQVSVLLRARRERRENASSAIGGDFVRGRKQ